MRPAIGQVNIAEDHGVRPAADFDSKPGTYALLLSSATDGVIQVGRRGSMQVRPGFYVYVGSALGPGGVRARLAHHLRCAQRPHWHIDYLRRCTTVEEIWCCYDRSPREHVWAGCVGALRGASVPMAGFGSSDCDCETHLFFFDKRPTRERFNRQLKKTRSVTVSTDRRSGPVRGTATAMRWP